MAKLSTYKGNVTLINGITQANGASFPLIEANAVLMDNNDTRLDQFLKGLDGIPVGSIIQWGNKDTIPSGFLIMDGKALNRNDYADLFNIIGTTYGNGDGVTTFMLPNQFQNLYSSKGTDDRNVQQAVKAGELPYFYIIKAI